jgi:hypothetical protein
MTEFGWTVPVLFATNGERAGLRCFAMELDPVYCNVAVLRWEMATRRVAERTFAAPHYQ